QALSAELKDQLKLSADKGALVNEVIPNSPAAKAGLQKNDLITHVGNSAVATPEDLRAAIQKARPDQDVTLKVMRGEEQMEMKVRLQGVSGMDEAFGSLPDGPEGFGHFPDGLPGFFRDGEKVKALEKKVQELEQRIRELEQRQAK